MTEKKVRISIRKKLLISYLGIVALILLIGIIGVYNIREVYSNGNEIYVNNLKEVECLKSIHQNVKEIDQCVVSMMSELDKKYHANYKKTIQKLNQENQELLEQYSGLEISALEKRRYQQCQLSIMTFDKQIESIMSLLESGEKEEAVTKYEQELMPAKACTYELIEAIVELATKNAGMKNEENHQIYQNLIRIFAIAMIVSVFIAVAITVYMNRNFSSKLKKIRQLAERIAEYNISDDIEEVDNDEFGETMAALNESQFMIRDLVEKIIGESSAIGDIGEEVSQAVRKSNMKIEAVNVDVYKAEDMTDEMEVLLNDSLKNRSLDQETVALLQEIIRRCLSNKANLQEVQSELTGIATYLDQIGITADYENQIANSYRELVQKFKV